MSGIKIDFYSEITCPWCIIGHHRLNEVLAERFPDTTADIVHHPVFLIPDCPLKGMLIADLARSRHGVSDPSVLWVRPEAEARISGLNLDLSRLPFVYPTQGAHTLIRLAYERGTQHQLAGAVYAAYFLEQRNISEPDVLADIASLHRFGRAEARALSQDSSQREITTHQAASAAAQGIRSVPHFFFGQRTALNGGCSEDELALAIESTLHHAIEP